MSDLELGMERISKKRRSIIAECDQDEAPDALFHYTSIESLALILSNKTLRLKSLTTLDDPEEAMAQDSQGFARYVFVSCWTEDKTESIPMWNMYAGLQSGVRIEMEPGRFIRLVLCRAHLFGVVHFPSSGRGEWMR